MDANEALSQLGQFGLYQLFVFVISCIPVLISGFSLMSTVFISATPEHRCFIKECDSSDRNARIFQINNTFSVPALISSCKRFSPIIFPNFTDNRNKCSDNWFSSHTIESCEEFVYNKREFHSTVVTEWNLVCDDSWKLPMSQSALMIGVLFGNLFFGQFSDRCGRKTLFTFVPIICLTTSLLTSFAPNLLIFTILTAITAACVSGMSQACFIIGIEFIGKNYRVLCANLQEVVYSSGTILLSIIAYNINEWRTLQIALSIPIVLTLFYPWLFPESVRWQSSNGQIKNALITLRKAAKWNRILLNEPAFPENKILTESSNSSQSSYDIKQFGPLDLWRNKTIRFWSLNLFVIWMIDSMIFYGLSFQASNLGSNTYLTLAAISAVDIPANLLVTIAMYFYGRRKVLFIFSFLAGLSCLSTVFIPQSSPLFTIIAIFGKSNITASYTLMYVYSAEIFPTVLRSTGVGLCTVFSRVGGIIAPHLIELSFLGQNIPLLLCGVLSLLCCVLSMNLPETFGKPLPETFEDVEALNDRSDEYNEKTKLKSIFKKKYIENDNKTQFI